MSVGLYNIGLASTGYHQILLGAYGTYMDGQHYILIQSELRVGTLHQSGVISILMHPPFVHQISIGQELYLVVRRMKHMRYFLLVDADPPHNFFLPLPLLLFDPVGFNLCPLVFVYYTFNLLERNLAGRKMAHFFKFGPC